MPLLGTGVPRQTRRAAPARNRVKMAWSRVGPGLLGLRHLRTAGAVYESCAGRWADSDYLASPEHHDGLVVWSRARATGADVSR